MNHSKVEAKEKVCPQCGNDKDDPRPDSIERMLVCGDSFHVAEPKPTPSTPKLDIDYDFACTHCGRPRSNHFGINRACYKKFPTSPGGAADLATTEFTLKPSDQPQHDSSSIPEVGKLKDLLHQAAVGMDTHYEETHPELVAAIKESCATISISTEQTFEQWLESAKGYSFHQKRTIEAADILILRLFKECWNAAKGQR